MSPNLNKKIFEYLSELGVFKPAVLKDIQQQIDLGKDLYEYLIERDLISDKNIGTAIANVLKIPFVELENLQIPDNVLKIIPEIVAKKQKIIAFEKTKKGLKVATSNPENTSVLEFIEKKTGDKVILYFATEKGIRETIKNYSKELQKTFDEILEGQVEKASETEEKEISISNIVETLIKYAYENKASDIHIEPTEENSVVRFRIDGVLHDVLTLPKKLHPSIITRIKVLARLRTDEHLSAQDGKMQQQLEQEELDIRVSIVPIVEGEKSVLRLLSSRSRSFSLQDLGMSEEDLSKLDNAYKKPFGMVLATGPTGSGKTTTIYAVLKVLNVREVNIATIEDPVEYDVEGINQIQVNNKTNLTFANGLKSILRQDPNIIFVGEIRDEETSGIAVNSALTGHLVLSTLHTNDAATTLPRLIDMSVEPFLVASTVNAIIAQRLVRKICTKCKVSYDVTIKELKNISTTENLDKHFVTEKKDRIRLYKGKGCEICHHTGYVGRIEVFEVLEMSPEVKELVVQKADSLKIKERAVKQGMKTMFEDGIDKVKKGITTIEEVLRVTKF